MAIGEKMEMFFLVIVFG